MDNPKIDIKLLQKKFDKLKHDLLMNNISDKKYFILKDSKKNT